MEISNWNKSRPKTKHFRQFMSSGFCMYLKVIYIRALTGLWMCFMIAAQTDTKVAVHLKILNISNKILTSIPKWTGNQWRDVISWFHDFQYQWKDELLYSWLTAGGTEIVILYQSRSNKVVQVGSDKRVFPGPFEEVRTLSWQWLWVDKRNGTIVNGVLHI